jgi:hypothetical protein
MRHKHPFQIEADKEFIQNFGQEAFDTLPNYKTTVRYSKVLNLCCDTEPSIYRNVEVFSNSTHNAIHIECPVCARQSFKIWLPIENKSLAPSEPQIRYWNSGKS